MTRRADTKIGRLRAALQSLLAEHEADGALPTSGRFIWYELEQQGVVDKDKARGHPGIRRGQDQDLADALTDLREDGLIPWDWITDETRTLDETFAAATVTDWVTAALDQARLDPWDGAPPLILTESRSLAGVLRPTAYRYAVPIASTNGQCGGFLRAEVAPRITPGQRILYLGDLDLAGGQIEANTRKVLESCTGTAQWERLALTEAQADGYDLRRLAIAKHDRRYKDGRPHLAIETEALSQRVLVAILTARLDALLPEPLEDVQVRERVQRAELRARLGGSS